MRAAGAGLQYWVGFFCCSGSSALQARDLIRPNCGILPADLSLFLLLICKDSLRAAHWSPGQDYLRTQRTRGAALSQNPSH
ncbi:hypothetical protein AALO_G00040030 [Alosa alosa]|uniref:Secreted protein n=1 Tax=Alosa alosa TaxID=278164 RepID=A0AAV6H798_9TELE|nr:hypothetical protein AALO_G00040030 [Alosa alosa]